MLGSFKHPYFRLNIYFHLMHIMIMCNVHMLHNNLYFTEVCVATVQLALSQDTGTNEEILCFSTECSSS